MENKTRKQIIIEKYNEIQQEISSITNKSILPPLSEIDIVDLVLLFNYLLETFSDTDALLQHLTSEFKINLTNDERVKLIPVLEKFIVFFHQFKKI